MISKEQKVVELIWQSKPGDIDPPNLDGCNLEVLSDQLVKAATLTSKFQQKFLDYLHQLTCNGEITWCQFLKSIIKFDDFQNFNSLTNLCQVVSDIIPQIQTHSFHNQIALKELVDTIRETFIWLLRVVKVALQETHWDEDEPAPYLHSLSATYKLIYDKFCGKLVGTQECAEEMRLIREIEEIFRENKETGYGEEKDVVKHLIEKISEGYHMSFITEKFQNLDCNLELFRKSNPTVRMLTSVFACYRVLIPYEEIADIYYVFSQIMKLSFESVAFDMIHAALLIRSQEHTDLPFLPRNRRTDFQWHIGIFFYMKMSKIWSVLINKYNQPKDKIVTVLYKVMDKLHNTLDIVDLVWRDCSIRSLVTRLVEDKVVDGSAAKGLIEMRLDQMSKNPDLDKLIRASELPISETDRSPSDCSVLKRTEEIAVSLQKPQNRLQEKLIMSLSSRIEMGNSFDAIIANLCVNNKMTDYSHLIADLNLKAQTATDNITDRIQTFDYSFLLLTRISIKWPSVPLKLLVNSSATSTPNETDGIFYQWATRYLKRVRKIKKKTEEEKKEEKEEKKKDEEEKKQDEEEKSEEKKDETEQKEKEKDEKEEEKDKDVEMKEIDKETEEKKEEEKEEKVEEKEKEDEEKKSEEEDKNEKGTEKEKKEEKKDNAEEEKIYECEPPFPAVEKAVAIKYLQKLKEREPFWDNKDISLNIPSLIHAIPSIGEVLLEEFGGKRVDRDNSVEIMVNILFALQDLSCLFVCLVQWIDCQKDTPARRSLAWVMLEAMDKCGDKTTNKWVYILSFLKQIIQEISEKTPIYPKVTCTAFGTSRRYCPRILRDEIPDAVKMKSAWYYMQNQSWATPHALRLLEHANCAGEYNMWAHIYVNKTIKMGCGDIMTKCVDMIASFLMLDHFNCLIRMHESLYDFWFSEAADNTNDGRFDPASLMPIIRLMTNVMLLSVWALEQQEQKCLEIEPPKKKLATGETIHTPDLDDPDSPEKWVHLLNTMIDVTINRFMKTLRKGVLSPVVCAISHLMKSIAGATDSHPKRLLVRRINPTLIFELAYIDPSSVTYEMLQEFCDPLNEQHKQEKIRFLCALRRRHVI